MIFSKCRAKIHLASYYCLALILVYGYSSSMTLGAPFSGHYTPKPIQHSAAHHGAKNLLSPWFKKNLDPVKNPPQNSKNYKNNHSEIWSRTRSHLALQSAKSSTIFQRHVKNYARSQDYINKVVRNASPYFYYVLQEVEKRGMPGEIALLPIIESDFNPNCTSNKGAVGIWQIMPELARLHGLKRNTHYDGRKDITQSTKVALDHLQYLHKKFNGNWLLALAAYNSGESRVQKAIKKNKAAHQPTDFWSLKLPKQTLDYVPKLLAISAIIKSPAQYGLVLPKIADQAVFTRVNTGKTIDLQAAAKTVPKKQAVLAKNKPAQKSKQTKIIRLNKVLSTKTSDDVKIKAKRISPL